MYKSFFLLAFLLFTNEIFSQEGFRPGYVVTFKNDTLHGKIKDRKYLNSSVTWQKIDFIDSAGNNKSFSPTDIKEYAKNDKTLYRSLTIGIEAEKTFLQVVENGAIILYSLNHGSGWGAAGNAIKFKTKDSEHEDRIEFFLQKKNDPNSLMQWRPRDYKSTAKFFFKDNAELLKSIEEDKLKASDIEAIVKKYNEGK